VTRPARPDVTRDPASLAPVWVDPATVTLFMLENVAILVWFAQPSAPAIDRVDRQLASLRAGAAVALSIIHIVKAPLQLPDDASRSRMVHVMKAHDVALVAMVVNESGFMLSMMRSVITGLRVLTAGRFDYRIDRTVDAVVTWFPKMHEGRTAVAIDTQQLLRTLQAADALTA
jgi:hypothetical protein